MMPERRGHRKLRLCSRKNYERKKYFPKKLPISIPRRTICIMRVSLPLHLLSFQVSLPLSAYIDSPVKSVDILYDRLVYLRTVPENWNCYMKDGVLSIYQLCMSDNGPVVALSLTVKQNFSWVAYYQNQPVASHLLQSNIPSSINSVSNLTHLIRVLCASKVCIDNPPDEMLPKINGAKFLQN